MIKYILLMLLLNSCALTLISPGINSNYRLNKITDIRHQEAAFYGSQFYQHSAFFVDKSNLKVILDDPNNFTFSEEQSIPDFHKYENDIILLFENCYDKEKTFDPELDILSYTFILNNRKSLHRFSYLYPYSYRKRGSSFVKKYPLYTIDNNIKSKKEILRTGDDFWSCTRTFTIYDRNILNTGLNFFQVLTSNQQNLEYSFEFKDEFVYFKDETYSISIK